MVEQVRSLMIAPTTNHQKKRDIAKLITRFFFKDDRGNPFEMTDGQADIFLLIFLKEYNRNQTIAPTQYGKSNIISMALILRTQMAGELFGIVTGSSPKSMIIMEKVIQHTFDHPLLYGQLDLDPNEPLDRIRRQRNREHMNWKTGGAIRTFTADARNRQRVKESLTGFGAPNIIEDEASLIPDDLQAMIMRMLGGHDGGWLLKIGNPFYRNHFLRTWQGSAYHKIFIDYHQAIAEGRYSESYIDEMRNEAFFDVLYECKFPSADEVDDDGWRRIVTDDELEAAFENAETEVPKGEPRLGVDIARGGRNFTTFVLRYDNVARLLEKNRDPDLMSQVARVESFMKEYNISAEYVQIDDVGVGGGVTDRLWERDQYVVKFKEGERADESDKYANRKAESSWLMADWIKNGGKIVKHDDFYQIGVVRYKEDSSSRLKIEPKAEMAKRGIQSPDVADGLLLTFTNSVVATADDFAII